MHVNAQKLPNDSVIEGDICIIGAGAAGISMALDMKDSGKQVILLEGGGFEFEKQMQDLYQGKNTGRQYYPLFGTRLHYFGGTTGHWAGMCSPMDEIDFKQRDWVPESGWPITKKDLDPFYAKAHDIIKLGPYEYDMEYWQERIEGLVPFPLDEDVFFNKMWQYNAARFNQIYKEEIINSESIHLYTYANVTNIKTSENGRSVTELVIKNHAEKEHIVKAKNFVMACGAMQNARLLLASNTQNSKGLGNDKDLVGRYFMEHLEIPTSELWLLKPFPTELYTAFEHPSAELALTEEAQAKHGVLNGTLSFTPLSVAKHIIPRIQLLQVDDYNEAVKRFFGNQADAQEKAKVENEGSITRAFELMIRIEQCPNPNSRITLDTEKDALGVPRIKFHWDFTPLDKYSIRTINLLLGEQMGKANLGRVKLKEYLREEDDDSWPDYVNAGWHHMGTTRMNQDPSKGVVDENCKVHGIDNLYVAGSACFTTSGAVNPTLTLVALSLRLSDHLKTQVLI